MDCRTYKLDNGITLTHIRTDRFKKASLSFSFTGKADRELSPKVSLIVPTAFRGTEEYGDFRAICRRAEELYAANISDMNVHCGNYHMNGLRASLLNDDFTDGGESVLEGVFGLCASILLHPLFRETDAELEKKNQINRIRSRKNNPDGYAFYRFNKFFNRNSGNDFTLTGEEEQVETVTADVLRAVHAERLANASFDVFYCGTADAETVIALINRYFGGVGGTLPYENHELTYAPDEPLCVEEEGEYHQGNLVLGFRSGVKLSDVEYYAFEMMNLIFGDGITSKLFVNVREKLSLCYYCDSEYKEEQGTLTVVTGISVANFEAAKNEILRQLDEIRRGNVTDAELEAARESVGNDCRAAEDHPSDYENFTRTARLYGGPRTIEEYRRGTAAVTLPEIVAAANKLKLDTVYFLRGTLQEEEPSDEE